MKVKIEEKNCVQADQKDHEMEHQNCMKRMKFSCLYRVFHTKKSHDLNQKVPVIPPEMRVRLYAQMTD